MSAPAAGSVLKSKTDTLPPRFQSQSHKPEKKKAMKIRARPTSQQSNRKRINCLRPTSKISLPPNTLSTDERLFSLFLIISTGFLTFTYVDNLSCPAIFFNSIKQTLSTVSIWQGFKGGNLGFNACFILSRRLGVG